MNRIILVSLIAFLLGGCQLLERLSREDEPESEPEPVPVEEPEPAPASEPAPEPAAISPSTRIRQAIDAMQNGEPGAARADLERILERYPGNRIARQLMRQIDAEPASLFEGKVATREVESGDSLAAISREVYGDELWFYGLARLNGIKEPRMISVGQKLLVPESVNAMPEPPQPVVIRPEPESPGDETTESMDAAEPASPPIVIDESDPEATARTLLEADREAEAISLLIVAARGDTLDPGGQELLLEAALGRSGRHLENGHLAAAQDALDRVRPWIGDIPRGPERLKEQETRIRARLNHREGVEALEQGEYEEAYTRLTESVQQDDSYTPAIRTLEEAESALVRHDHERALRAYRDQKLEEAIKLWDQVLEIDPDFEPAQVYRQRAMALRARLEEL